MFKFYKLLMQSFILYDKYYIYKIKKFDYDLELIRLVKLLDFLLKSNKFFKIIFFKFKILL